MAFALLTACGDAAVTLTHVHGLAYSPDGQRLSIPSHHGLAIYSAGRWRKAAGPEHDYMGYAVTRRAIYSSGHPAQGSGLTNPFGLIKSSDDGRTWQQLGLQGEADFHLLAAGFDNGALYVFNGRPNSRMSAPGLYFSLNGGLNWQRAAAQGLSEAPVALAVHPTDSKVVALTTSTGLYVSRDAGQSFQALSQGEQTVGLAFSLDGNSLWFGSYGNGAKLSRLELATGQVTPLSVPELKKDAVAYLAQNPTQPQEWAMATFKRDVYVSKDGGKSWSAIAKAGQTLK
ncbi:F510_1955 family glycosylhydrolase [Pseudomonas sp. TCU-HL1]|uniref:F510_1955 family glycosylhydrolase n=1 Tax=Pseudomonas sp. TCU-HL1 TaxID=1856685 RepID=UPI001F3B00C0|nr:glycosyl hydrolase [Pseudomonas sp. TCU-HL1]